MFCIPAGIIAPDRPMNIVQSGSLTILVQTPRDSPSFLPWKPVLLMDSRSAVTTLFGLTGCVGFMEISWYLFLVAEP